MSKHGKHTLAPNLIIVNHNSPLQTCPPIPTLPHGRLLSLPSTFAPPCRPKLIFLAASKPVRLGLLTSLTQSHLSVHLGPSSVYAIEASRTATDDIVAGTVYYTHMCVALSRRRVRPPEHERPSS